jgi:hypothetical protein
MVGVFVKAFYVYRFKSEQEEKARSWGKPSR